MNANAIAHALIIDHEAITDLPVAPIGELQGVERKILWRGEDSEAGILVVFPGHQLAHAHTSIEPPPPVGARRSRHDPRHQVGSGSFIHVPSGVEHNIDARRTNGCAVFYVYAPSDR